MPVLAEQKRLNLTVGRATFSVLLFQDLAVAPILFTISVLGSREQTNMLASFVGALSQAAIALIVIVILLLFGAKRVPQLARSLGHGLREFKESVTDHTSELKDAAIETPKELRRGLDPDPAGAAAEHHR